MASYVQAEYAPPRSWDQFEELCADTFQSIWSDPGLIRNGRAGQRQDGVDIIARNGAAYPIGLQCKKCKQWPERKLTAAKVNREIAEALKFKPSLKSFYILTTAPDDAELQKHIRAINQRHSKEGLFEVVVLGWDEIVRRATHDPAVADKHFGPAGDGKPRSPLLASWFVSKGKLEKAGDDLALSVQELIQDLHDWPNGHFVIRQREADEMLEKLRPFEGKLLGAPQRKARIELRNVLRSLTDADERAVQGIRLMLTEPVVAGWLLKIWDRDGDVPISIEAFINHEVHGSVLQKKPLNATTLRMSPPKDPERRCSTDLSKGEYASIIKLMDWRRETYGNPLTKTVAELPPEVRARKATPRIIRGVLEFVSEHRLSWGQVEAMGALDVGQWTISLV